MLPDFFIPLAAVGLAELGDKTQLALFALSSQTRKHFQLLLGSALAFVFTNGIAVLIGDYINQVISFDIIKHVAGIIFIIFGILTLLKNNQMSEQTPLVRNPFLASLVVVFLAEIGDKSQIATGLFATKYNALFVFAGVMVALTVISALAIWLGKTLLSKVRRRSVLIGSAIIFIVIGIAFQL
ncbi:MAG: TMEM165/GDT1 family protein [Patescibacteria group bacterium]